MKPLSLQKNKHTAVIAALLLAVKQQLLLLRLPLTAGRCDCLCL